MQTFHSPGRIAPCVATVFGGLSAPTAHVRHWGRARPRIIQSVDVTGSVSAKAPTIAGTPHLAYELHVANFRSVDVSLVRLDVQDPSATPSSPAFLELATRAR